MSWWWRDWARGALAGLLASACVAVLGYALYRGARPEPAAADTTRTKMRVVTDWCCSDYAVRVVQVRVRAELRGGHAGTDTFWVTCVQGSHGDLSCDWTPR